MPIGCSSLVPYLAAELAALQPASVLDLGCGFGWAGAAVRQWLDQGVQPWRTRLVGVEVWEAYRSAQWGVYDAVEISEIADWLAESAATWDCILLLDVLEHFEAADGAAVLAQARRALTPAGRLYVATPAIWWPQGAVNDNEAERHHCLWTAQELQQQGGAVLWDGAVDRWGNAMLLASFSKVF